MRSASQGCTKLNGSGLPVDEHVPRASLITKPDWSFGMKTQNMWAGLIVAGAVAAVAGAGPANATGSDDANYLSCTAEGFGHPSSNPLGTITWGHHISAAISVGVSPIVERDYVYYHSDATMVAANVLVNCAQAVYGY